MYNNSAAELKRWLAIMKEHADVERHIKEEAKKACAECQEFNCDGCIYKEYRNG